VARPPPDRPVWRWPSHPHGLRGWFDHPSSFTFFFSLTGVVRPPVWWWPSHPSGLRGGTPPPVGGSTTLLLSRFFFPLIGGGPATPLGHWGGSATTRPAGMVVAEPPQWPKWPVWVDRPPFSSSLTFFFF
jgi:hypothetical protein